MLLHQLLLHNLDEILSELNMRTATSPSLRYSYVLLYSLPSRVFIGYVHFETWEYDL